MRREIVREPEGIHKMADAGGISFAFSESAMIVINAVGLAQAKGVRDQVCLSMRSHPFSAAG